MDPAIPAVPALVRESDHRTFFLHLQHITRAVLGAFSAEPTVLLAESRGHQ